jgi:hypothetical protein
MTILRIYQPHRPQINEALFKSKKMSHTWQFSRSGTLLFVADDDFEEVDKVLARLESPYKIKE